MANLSTILDFQYNVMKMRLANPLKRMSFKDRQVSDLSPTYQPSVDEMDIVFRRIARKDQRLISTDDIKSLLEALGKKNAACEAKAMVQVADLNKDGFIDFKEFMEVHKKGISANEIRSAFWVFDQNGDGRIDAAELMAVLKKLGENCTLKECERMVKQVDKSGDGLVDMDDFMLMMTSTMKPV